MLILDSDSSYLGSISAKVAEKITQLGVKKLVNTLYVKDIETE